MIAFERVALFDGTRFLEPLTVVVDGDRIASVGEGPAPEGAERIGGSDRTLMPGFIDSHVHIGLHDPARVLRGGVTTVRDLGAPLDFITEVARRSVAGTASPLVLFAGPLLTPPDGYPTRERWAPKGTGLEVGSPEQARDAVRALAAGGASVIKVAQEPAAGPTLGDDVLSAIVAEARTAGLRTVSHCGTVDELGRALACGVDGFAHGLWADEEIPDDFLAQLAGQGSVVVPTLHVRPTPPRVENVARFLEMGGEVVYGTDMGNPPSRPGIDVEEIRLMRAAGMTLEEVLAAATARAAAHLGLGDRGRIEPGARADLVLLEGDPREDLSVLARPRVWRAGAEAMGSGRTGH